MSLKSLSKAHLVDLAEKLSLQVEGTKAVLEDRISHHFDNHPELENDDDFKKFVVFRKKTSPVKSTQNEIGNASSPSRVLKPLSDTLKSSPGKLFNISSRFRGGSSPSKADESEEEEEEDDDDDEEEDSDEDIEILSSSSEVKSSENVDADTQDADYVPNYELVTRVKDWFIDHYESTQDFFLDLNDSIVDTAFTNSNNLKKYLSTAETVNTLTSVFEFATLIHAQVPIIKLKDAKFLDQSILSKYHHYLNLDFPIYDLSYFLDFKILLVLFTWGLLFTVLPAIGSYYFNFVGKKHKKTKYDPLVFNLIKVLIGYFYLSGSVSFDDVKNNAEVWADEHGLLDNASILSKLQAHSFHNSITLRLILGNLPFIDGFVGILVALYVASI